MRSWARTGGARRALSTTRVRAVPSAALSADPPAVVHDASPTHQPVADIPVAVIPKVFDPADYVLTPALVNVRVARPRSAFSFLC